MQLVYEEKSKQKKNKKKWEDVEKVKPWANKGYLLHHTHYQLPSI